MSKPTPGPWQVNHSDPTQVCDSDGEARGCAPIALCTVGTMAERRANARLIAAAPALLAALEHVTAGMTSSGDEGVSHLDFMVSLHWLKKARAAIAKATS